MKRTVAYYSVFLGFSIIGIWFGIIKEGNIPEGKIAMGFHLYSEITMAIICIVSGILMIRKKTFGVETNIAGHAMVIYSVINAAGYYAQLGNKLMMNIFIMLFALSVTAVYLDYHTLKKEKDEQ